jgi:hypothetical protein
MPGRSSRLRLLLALLWVLTAASCRRQEAAAPSSGDDGAAPQAAGARGEGLLRASEVVIHGVRLPVGLERAYAIDGEPVYHTHDGAPRVVAFFAARYGRGALEPIGEGGVFRALEVTEGGAPRRVDISVLARSTGGARVQVHRLPEPAAGPEADPEARLRAYTEHLQTLD